MSKRVFVVGEGAREHALCWALSKSSQVSEIHCAPGNGGTSYSATNVPIGVTDISGLTSYAAGGSFDSRSRARDSALPRPRRQSALTRIGPPTVRRRRPRESKARSSRQAGHARRRRANRRLPELR